MNGEPYSTVREAMRLMQAGDLLAATAAIQHRLGGATAAEPSTAAESPNRSPIEGTFRVVDEIPLAKDGSSGGSPRAPAPEERTQFSEHTYTGSAGTRRYKLFIPSAYRGQPLPLVVMLHGCTQTPDDFATGTRMNMLAEERECFIVYPSQPQTANMSKCWNWFKASDQRRDQGEPAIIAGLVRELLLTYGLDRERVYVGGLSAGGAMAVILGRAYPELFAAVGVHSGLPYAAAHDLPSAFAAMHRGDASESGVAPCENLQAWRGAIPTIVFHGDLDTTVHPCNGEKVVSQSAGADSFNAADNSSAAAATVERCASGTPGGHSYTRRIFTDGSGKIVVEYWLVHGAGHAWFGGDPRGSYTDSKGPDASGEMIRFFLERTRPSSCWTAIVRA
jgi:poly(hydroxyalkanoate) depolymerase family esterase